MAKTLGTYSTGDVVAMIICAIILLGSGVGIGYIIGGDTYYDDGYDSGYVNGRADGYEEGYRNGYKCGVKSVVVSKFNFPDETKKAFMESKNDN